MRKIMTMLALQIWVSAAFAQSTSLPDAPRLFDFWVGSWTASWDEGEGVKPFGQNTILWTLDSTVIQENFEITAGKNKGFKGTSISVFQPPFNRWKQAWADNQGGYFDFTSHTEGTNRIFKTQVIDRGDKKIQSRMVFSEITPNSMKWDWEQSQDGGETWALQWRIFYTRNQPE